MSTKTPLTAAALILVAIPSLSLAQAQDGRRMAAPQFDFAAADADASGAISQEEWTAYVTAQMNERRATRLGAMADRLIAAGDADADGQLTRDEVIAGYSGLQDERREARAARAEDGDHEHRRGHRHGHRGDRDQRGRGMERMDPAEGMSRAFERMDRNDDGQIDANEFSRMQERMQERMERRMERRGSDEG
ncbi:hypothetical protein [Pararhodobacter oceanensis]|uniref:hypothetical protein n=1 Tax=Pararhodobacter oceanensis TaxID=2172121 RepID=UPI003A95B337